jgi:hypothetical protein
MGSVIDRSHPGGPSGRRLRDRRQAAGIEQFLAVTRSPAGSALALCQAARDSGAQLSFTDVDGHRRRFQATLTDLAGDAVEFERLHRARANARTASEPPRKPGLATSRSASSR